MQNRYAGDIGDFVKLGLLRALAPGQRLGVAWYLYPDEAHNSDGRHTAYLSNPSKWRHLDPELFDGLSAIARGRRSVSALERSGLLPAAFFGEPMPHSSTSTGERCAERQAWFGRALRALEGTSIVFADPDNGLTDDEPKRRRGPRFDKHIPLLEALALANGRCAVIYHHNSRFKGGHDAEVEHWRHQLGAPTIAIRAAAFSCRTFFIVNGSEEIQDRAERFACRWSEAKVRLHA